MQGNPPTAARDQTRESRLADFVAWCATHITGDEKGEAQTFIDHLFVAFGQKGAREVGGTFEERIRQLFDDRKRTGFADYVWKGVVLIEMKKRGADLAKHRQQAFDYWTHIAPGKPKYVVLCNFDEFWVYDFNNQIYVPKDKIALVDLPQRWGPLAFLFPTREQPVFGNDVEKVSREAADKLALCFRKMIARGVDRDLAQRFVLQSMIAMFAEDIGLLPRYLFANLLGDCHTPADSFDKLGGLFEAMNTNPPVTGGRYKGVRYFNGGLFTHPARVELYPDELAQLRGVDGTQLFGAAQSDWSKVSPEIFGAIFQESMDAEERHAYGAHYTSPTDIMKIVKPTISDPWSAAIDAAKTGKQLTALLERLTTLRVLDPACGSGNFLYLAYREMKRLETKIRDRLTEDFPGEHPSLVHVNARQFFGMDINPFAVELAKVTLMIGRKFAIEELHIGDEADLPLDNLDANFHVGDALLTPSPGTPGEVRGEGELPDDNPYAHALKTPWPPADVIIGNPPFLGAKRLKPERGPDYVNALRKLYPEVPGMADYCVYWIRRTADHLPECTKEDSFAGRAGLVGTQNIRNNQSRVGGLDHVLSTGTVIDAVDNQPWSGEANVHVSITNWMRSKDGLFIPKRKRLWTKVLRLQGTTPSSKRGIRADKVYELASRDCDFINAALTDKADLTTAIILEANREPKKSFVGQMPGHIGFVLELKQAQKLKDSDRRSADVIFPYVVGRELLTGDQIPSRSIIDFQDMDMPAALQHPAAFQYLREKVLPDTQSKAGSEEKGESARQTQLDRWWKLWRGRGEMLASFKKLGGRYFACSRVTKRPIFFPISTSVRPGDRLQVFAFDDDYSFGILQSFSHWSWFIELCPKLKSDFMYSTETVFDTFPWPQSPTNKQIEAVAAAAVEVRRVRAEALALTEGGLRAVYRTLELPGKHPLKDAHAKLDAAVLAAYGFDPKGDLLAQLLALNQFVAAREAAGDPVTPPGIPPTYPTPQALITPDCIRP